MAASTSAHAGRLNIDIPGEVYALQQGASVDSVPGVQPPVLVTAQRLIYDRQKLWMRAEGGAKSAAGQDWLAAVRIFGNLSDDETRAQVRPRLLGHRGGDPARRRRWLRGRPRQPTRSASGGEGPRGGLPAGGEPGAAGGAAGRRWRARVQMESTGGGVFRTPHRAPHRGDDGERRAERARTPSAASRSARSRGWPASRSCARPPASAASATFKPDGQLATMTFDDNVVYHDGQVTATGNHGALDIDAGARRVRRRARWW